MLKSFRIDLHNHSCLSPCGSLDMSPKAMAQRALELGIDVLGLTDHNSALNCPAFEHACRSQGILPVFGLEITTQEELHCLALFGQVDSALAMGEWVEERILKFPNHPEKMGDQVYLDKDENILGEVEWNLAQGAVSSTLEELGSVIQYHKGLFIPAHIDRPSFSLLSQLGFVPPNPYDAIETIRPKDFSDLPYPIITGSDAHYLEDMGKRVFSMQMEGLDFISLKKALTSGAIKT